jgi:hypothetical protein
MTLKRYTLSVTSAEHWEEIHGALTIDSNQDGIPDRKVTCTDEHSISSTRGTYELTDEEVLQIRRHPHVKWIEPSLKDNRDEFPEPLLAEPQRFDSDVKIYRDLTVSGNRPPASNPTSAEENRTNWALPRISGIATNGDLYPNEVGSIAPTTGNFDFLYDGRHVDIVIQDSGVLQSHPEFLNDDGTSRVKDLVLDFPYFLDPGYFNSRGFTFTLEDGSTGIDTARAEAWWEDNNARSTEFVLLPEIVIPSGYNRNGAIGIGTAGGNNLGSGHGTSAASLAAGKNFGLAFKANIWAMPCVSDNVGMDIETSYDLISFFHQYKPVNTEIGRRNPTVVNGSWGYQAAVRNTGTIAYKFVGINSTIDMSTVAGGAPSGVEDMIFGFNNQVLGAYKSWSSSSRSNATNEAGDDMMNAGVIFVASAGNNNQYIGAGFTDPHRLNGLEDAWFTSNDPRPEFGGQRTPTSHRDWMNPQGIGFNEDTGYHPVINVGAMDDFVESNYKERKASYSNSGPGVDIYAPAQDTLAAGLPSGSYADFQRYDNPTHYDNNFNGTSAAAPVVTGLVALYLQRNPGATSQEVRQWLLNDYGQGVGVGTTASNNTVVSGGSTTIGNDLFFDQHTSSDYGDSNFNWWTGSFNQRTADGSGEIQIAYLDVSAGILTESAGINEPTIDSPINNDVGVSTEGLQLRSSPYIAIGDTTVSGTLKAVEFELATDSDFNNVVWESVGDLDAALTQTVDVQLAGFTTHYARVRHLSNDDGTSFTSYTSTFSAGIVSFATLGNAPGVAAPTILAPDNGAQLQQRFGITLQSSAFVSIDGEAVSGTLKAVEFQVAEDIGFSDIVFSSIGANNTALSQVISDGLNSNHTFYVRVRHLSNADGTSGVAHVSPWSATTTFTTPAAAIAEVGRLASIKTTLTKGVVEPVQLYESDNLLEVSIGVANQNDFRSTFSIGISSTPGFKNSDYITYGIPLDRGGTRLIEKVGVKPGDKIFVSSFDPNISFIAFATKKFDKLGPDSALVHGRKRSGTLGFNPPFQINTNLEFFTAQEDSLVTVHATNQNSDSTVGMSVGLSSGGIAEFQESDYLVFGLRLAPLQDVQIDNLALAKGQSLIVRGSKPNLTFVAHSVPQDPGPSGIGTNINVNTSGNITANAFFGDGSGITGVTAVGSGVEVRDNDTAVGTAATINFGQNISVSQISAGIVTITGADTVSIAETANSLADGVSVPSATRADFATVAGLATEATTATSALSANTATTASVASGLSSDATITSNNTITAPRFIGDGSQLTNVVGTGAGVVIKEDGSNVGTAATVNFTSPVTVTPISAGIVTITVGEVPRSTLSGIASEAVIAGLATYATLAGVASQATNALFANSSSFSTLTGAADTAKNLYTQHEGNFKPLPTTIGTKTTDHRYYGIGSDRSINVQGYESPYLRFEVGQTYRFENASQQANYPIRFYYAADGEGVGFGTTTPNQFSDNVTETGTYTEITIDENTPQLLYYGAGVGTQYGSMGNSIQVFNNDFHKVSRVGEFKNLVGLKTATYTQFYEGRATSWYMNTNLGVGNSDYVPGDRSHNVSSILHTSTGTYTVNFADAMADTDYAVIGIASGTNAFPGGIVNLRISDRTVNGYTVRVYNSIPALEDLGELSIMTLGGQDGERTYI